MTFSKPDADLFPGLALAWHVLRAPLGSTAVLNAANEVAVAAFLARKIRFDQIHYVNSATLEAVRTSQANDIADLLAVDAQARAYALALTNNLEQ
jgi:1-deoxy-D-xylulose-5-phosphate reductoisomerase